MTGTQAPLAARMRPASLADYRGQQHLLGEGQALRRALDAGQLHSMIFWGPPGVGKTTLARLIAQHSDAHFLSLSAVLAGVKDIRKAVEVAQQEQRYGRRTVLFIDEVHRFNKAQQDAFLPYVEDGTLIFVGATTENPSFEINNALLSRARVYPLRALDTDELLDILQHACAEEGWQCEPVLLEMLARQADGDARRALNLLELAMDVARDEDRDNREIGQNAIDQALSHQPRRFDKGGDLFYEQISALHKSVRGSSPDGALYWLLRMLDGGCDPAYLLRRVTRMASEDIGLADPRALPLCLSAWDTFDRLGAPEGELAIAEAVLYLAVAPKSNAAYVAFKTARGLIQRDGSREVPLHLRNAPTGLMKTLGYGDGYQYDPDHEGGVALGQGYWPEGMAPQRFYAPVDRGLEIKIGEKLARLRARRTPS